MEKKLTVDRIEEDIAVLFDENGNEYKASLDYKEGTILLCEVDEGGIRVLETLAAEAAEKKASNASRLKTLFSREGRGRKDDI